MRKFLAVVRREYWKIVWAKTFVVATLLAPLVSLGFVVVPALIFSIEGNALRVAVVDQSGKLSAAIEKELSSERQREKEIEKAVAEAKKSDGNFNQTQEEKIRRTTERTRAKFAVEEFNAGGKTLEQIKRELNGRLNDKELDGYIIVPQDFENAPIEYFARNTADFIAQSRIEDAVNEAVRRVRMTQENISQTKLDALNKPVAFNAVRVSSAGENTDDGGSFITVFVVGLLIYLTLAIYGNVILGAVVEEKETRIAEILFSSARPFTLMLGKLVGVGLAALTQLGIWVLSGVALIVYSLTRATTSGVDVSLPNVSIFSVFFLFVFFLLGFFTYATIYALIGSMVTTVQEGGQLALPPVLLLLIAFYCSFPVIRQPDSDLAFWTSILPFFSPMIMPVRMAIQMPALWQIGLAILLNLTAILALVWAASRVYRIGMLMYGKKATIPEVLRWIRQS
jgi:ABC-2 type transport system permease protein